jgi:hypothetical protein
MNGAIPEYQYGEAGQPLEVWLGYELAVLDAVDHVPVGREIGRHDGANQSHPPRLPRSRSHAANGSRTASEDRYQLSQPAPSHRVEAMAGRSVRCATAPTKSRPAAYTQTSDTTQRGVR